MRKREKTLYIIGIAAATGAFIAITKPSLRPHGDTQVVQTITTDTIAPVFRISPYDNIFRHYADTVGWDWKMLAAVAYVESKFDTSATSAVGAQGLMQMMPHTARAMGIPEGMERDPEESVRAAAKYFNYLSRLFRRVPENERMHFVLASYNAGYGHVQDAMRLAEKYGKSRHVWNGNVETFLRLKNDSIYYTDSVCKNGKFTGHETTLFVRKVQHKYSEYCLREERYWETHRDTTHYTPRAFFVPVEEEITNNDAPTDSATNDNSLASL